MTSDYEVRYSAALRATDAAGLKRSTVETPIVRALRAIGLKPRPPHFATFGVNVMTHGVVFAFVWGLLMWVLVWSDRVPAAYAAVAALGSGILFGVVIAFLYRGTAERSGLPRWEEVSPH